ncbi:heavy metal translocating P-type ATPase [Actinomadura rudentiformis]|uniref:Heavy metal translocating P-type ATPase n=1 Tax=Actinomadura rudentiformis TaxID=359158 RepID=A0A6H9YY45_9ACTN|nr:heavy metal translocating P-type ATPase [Actinomadura rudentiformis]KAB2352374.1 heavy metal translocating P-type ATPase [Actinomadura rudentiformis]
MAIGYKGQKSGPVGSAALTPEDAARERLRLRRTALWDLSEVRWATAATVLFAAGGLSQLAGAPAAVFWALYLACYVTGGWEPAWSGIQALKAKALDVDLLMVVAAIGAAAIGQVLDGALLIVIFATSGALEALATQRTADAVRGLSDLAPDRATLLTPEGERSVDPPALAVGDVILVRPGERLAADGEVIDGTSEVDQATITGEGLPVAKGIGDEVLAGTSNGTGMLRVRVNRPAGETVIARIAAMVEEASRTKARTQLFVEKIEQRYSVGMVVATLLLFTVPLLWGAELQATLLRAMTFMIVASPCAVVLATMPPLLAAIANAGRHGVLVKSAVAMEHLGQSTVVAFDKTGTLTEGTPRLIDIRVLDTALSTGELLALAAAAENPSEHPLAQAVVAAARTAGVRVRDAEEFGSVPGRGVTARVGGRLVEIGSPGQLLREIDGSSDLRAAVAALEEAGQTAIVVRVDGKTAGVLGLADRPRPDAAAATTAVTGLTGRPPVLLSGDNHRAAALLAAQVGIVDVQAGLLPADKVSAVQRLQREGRRVLLVGDGVNDAPALAAADTGVAMGRAGSDLALDSADVVIARDELTAVPAVIALSRRARRVVTANLIIAASFITVLVVWDLAGHLPLPLGVAGHEGSTIIVGLNGLRLLRSSVWNRSVQSSQRPHTASRSTAN